MTSVHIPAFFASVSVLAAFASLPLRLAANTSNPAQVGELYREVPLQFEPNQGQTDPHVRFLAHGVESSIYLTGSEAVLVLGKGAKRSSKIRLQLAGGNSTPEVEGINLLPGRTNYYVGRDPAGWRTNIASYARVRYKNVYPGVDLIYYGHQGQLEYDFVVAPDTNPHAIQLRFRGVRRMRLRPNGDLWLYTDDAHIEHHKPVIYQEIDGVRQAIAGGYVRRRNGRIGFQVARYDTRRPLIIDPVLIYSTYLGGTGGCEGGVSGSCFGDYGTSIAIDSAGNAYVSGYTYSHDFPVLDASQAALRGLTDSFVSKLSPSGALLYSTYLGGSAIEFGSGIAADPAGNAYVTGYTVLSKDFPTLNAFQPVLRGETDAFVSKLSPSGALLYSTYLGGSGADYGRSIAADTAGNAYVTGSTGSDDFPVLNGLQPALRGQQNAFVTKFSASGTLLYSSYLGGSNADYGTSIAADSAGNAYVTGTTSSADFPVLNAFQPALRGGAFVTKLRPGGALLYSTYLRGSSGASGSGIAADAAGNAYVTGYTYSDDFPTLNALQPTRRGYMDAFVTKLSASGALLYSTYLGGSEADDSGSGIAVDAIGNAYITGYTYSNDFLVLNAVQPVLRGSVDAFVTKVSPGGALLFSTYLGGSGGQWGAGGGRGCQTRQ